MNAANTVCDKIDNVAALVGLLSPINLSLQPSSIQVLHATVLTKDGLYF